MITCSKNGIKKEGESCSLNNNCIYPNCLEKTFTEKDMIDFAEWCVLNANPVFPNKNRWNFLTKVEISTKELFQEFLKTKK